MQVFHRFGGDRFGVPKENALIPIRDNVPSQTTPFVGYAIILLCGITFFLQLTGGEGGDDLVEQFGMVPLRISRPGEPAVIEQRVLVETPAGIRVAEVEKTLEPSAIPPLMTLITCMFLHGGWLHFIGNMWFLYIFGDNVEDRLGHLGFALLYLGTGIAAGAAHLLTNLYSPIPTIGASGAIAGVMGAYMFFHPRAQVVTLIPIVFILHLAVLPAYVFLGLWFALQFFQGFMSVGDASTGVAWWAHVGGFAAGAAVGWLLDHSPFRRQPEYPPERWPSQRRSIFGRRVR